MADNFDKAIDTVLRHEGIFSNDPSDPGGATKYGISLRFLKQNKIDLNHDGFIDIDDVSLMSEDEAKILYRSHFWDRYKYDRINSPRLAIMIFDFCVNMGPTQIHKISQRACNLFSNNLVVDGALGNKSFDAINKICLNGEDEFVAAMKDYLILFYNDLTNKNKSLKKFLKGWINRVNDF